MSWSGGLNPSAVAGKPSVTRLTHSSCTGLSTSGIPALHGVPLVRCGIGITISVGIHFRFTSVFRWFMSVLRLR